MQFQVAFDEESELTSGRIGLNFMQELDKYLEIITKSADKSPGGVRISIDPITPLLLEIPDLNEQRNVLQRVFHRLRKIGTTICTLERGFGETMEKIPSYLCDSIIELIQQSN